jgi:CRISPR-associated endonuclease/helicase Cas3
MIEFELAFVALTGNSPFPWQQELFQEFVAGRFPASCNLPTGLGKTSVIAIWLLALATAPTKVPRRLVYVVNRRTVVDQSTEEAKKLRDQLLGEFGPPSEILSGLSEALEGLSATPENGPLAISTLRGQFADNREWSADPSRPAVIVGTVDMIGSRLLFSGYGIGFKAKPLHAGFLGQDVLLVHDEAHLEPAFQELLIAVQKEQERCKEFQKFIVMELSATSRGKEEPFKLTPADNTNPVVEKRITAKKAIHLHYNQDEKKLSDEIANVAEKHKDSGRATLVFVRKVDDVEKIVAKLKKEKQQVQQLTGTLRGLERDQLIDDPIFARFLPPSSRSTDVVPAEGAVYLVCTSAGEVGVNISADHLVCDLSTFESMAQRFGRVNRFGDRDDTCIDIVCPTEFKEENEFESRLRKTLDLLKQLNGDGSPKALGNLDASARLAAFAPSPAILPSSDILFDTWALTSIRNKLPGRPPVEPYLHGLSSDLPETHVAWREEVGVIIGDLLADYQPADLLDDFTLKPHELLRDNTSRVFDRLKKLKAPKDVPVWLLGDDDSVSPTTLGDLIEAGKDDLAYKTVLLPPSAGGLENGMLASNSDAANDVAEEWRDEKGNQRRVRVWDGDPRLDAFRKTMRLVRRIDLPPPENDEDAEGRSWHWFELPSSGDSEGSKTNNNPVAWQVHTDDVTNNAAEFVERLPLSEQLKQAVKLAAKWHDLGKKREIWQRSIGNPDPKNWLAKSGGKMKLRELTDYWHEFGSLMDVLDPKQPYLKELQTLSVELQDVVLHLIAVHHGFGRPHFPMQNAFDPSANGGNATNVAANVPQRFARLQRRYGRWGLAYLESLLRAADYAASARPSEFVEEQK